MDYARLGKISGVGLMTLDLMFLAMPAGDLQNDME